MHPWDFKFRAHTQSSLCLTALWRKNFDPTPHVRGLIADELCMQLERPHRVIPRSSAAAVSTQQNTHGLYLVCTPTVPARDTQALANQIVARIQRDFAHANPKRPHLTYLPASFFEPRRDTPMVILRRIFSSIYSFTFST